MDVQEISKDLMRKLQNTRCSQKDDLINLYMEAVAVDSPPLLLSFLETILGDTNQFDANKTIEDVHSIILHNITIKQMKKRGEDIQQYCQQKVIIPLLRQLQHDRANHVSVLQNIAQEVGTDTPLSALLQAMLSDRTAANDAQIASEAHILARCTA